MALSGSIKLIIGKSDKETGRWLPMFIHAEDAAGVTEYLLKTRYQSLADICGIEYGELVKTAKLLAYLHDIGKITPLFQARILSSLPDRRKLFEDRNINILFESQYNNKQESHHSKCGEYILNKLGFSDTLCSIVGAHHGKPCGTDDHIIRNMYGEGQECSLWESLHREWAEYSLKRSGFSDKSEIPILNKITQMLLTGLLIVSDWLASDETKFGLIDEEEFPSEDEYSEDRLYNAACELNIPDVWTSESYGISDEDFQKRFGFPMNEIQRGLKEAAENCDSAGLYILEAPMGTGKTEAALAAAEILAARCEKNGLFFGLPTQATANGVFDRVADWAKQQSCEEFHSVKLEHGNAEIQPEYAKIKSEDCHMDHDSGLVVHSFFESNKKSLLADFVVGTVDRLLMTALKKKHVMMLHLGISQKVVVVDECHAYDAYMNRYLDRALSWLHDYKAPVILLSATLPPERRRELVSAYLKTELREDKLQNAPYPRLTYINNDKAEAVQLCADIPEKTVDVVKMEDSTVIDEIRKAVGAGACVGVICNTAARAQSFADEAANIENANVILYHAQFIFPDRAAKEEELKKAVGKSSSADERSGTVVVGTQVLEQSLDIDFDILITDLCPMDLLLQRIGRTHRHRRADRPDGYKTAKCIVLGTDIVEAASGKIYTEWLLFRTRKLLPETIGIPSDIDRLVCEAYARIEPESDEEKAAYADYALLLSEKKRRAESFLMPEPRDSRRKNDLHSVFRNGIEDNENMALAAVRDGISSIEVIVLMQLADGKLNALPWQSDGTSYDPAVCPDEDHCKLIAGQKLRLPSVFCSEWAYEKVIRELEEMDRHLTGFQNSPLLKGELFLLLDENFTAELYGYTVTYSQSSGLSHENLST